MAQDSFILSALDCAKGTRDWPHAPPHRLLSAGVYFLTARTAERRDLLASDEMKDWFQEKLLELAQEFGWTLEAWAIFSNHYHLIAHSPPESGGGASLGELVRKLHSLTTKELNRRDNKPCRSRLWQNFRETHLLISEVIWLDCITCIRTRCITSWCGSARIGNGVALKHLSKRCLLHG